MVGVKEVKRAKSNVEGITSHIDDANIQQFVNTKTNRPVTFSYQTVTWSELQIGVIHIPIQARPIYLKKPFGKLKANKVYIRRGSSTDIARPDEIAQMGTVSSNNFVEPEKDNPVFEAIRQEKEAGNTVIVEFVVHNFHRSEHLCKIVVLNELYACFVEEGIDRNYESPISHIEASYSLAAQKKKLIIYHSC